MKNRFDISLTEAAKNAAEKLAEEGMFLRFAVTRSGCCSMAVSIYPDAERVNDEIIEADGVRLLTKNEYQDLIWRGTIDYKEKGLRRGFIWK